MLSIANYEVEIWREYREKRAFESWGMGTFFCPVEEAFFLATLDARTRPDHFLGEDIAATIGCELYAW